MISSNCRCAALKAPARVDGDNERWRPKRARRARVRAARSQAVEKYARHASQVADKQVLRHAEVRKNVRLLMDDPNSGCVRLDGGAQAHGRAVDDELARVRLIDALHDARQRGFARSILADQREDFPRADRQGDLRQRMHDAEALADAAKFRRGVTSCKAYP